jgi:hypothetical protein
MQLLKYLDVLIGLALVMVLLSPLVSAFTQLWMWISNTRSGRLQVGLKNLILQLSGTSYSRFDAIAITGYPPGQRVTMRVPDYPDVAAQADAMGTVRFEDNIPDRLQASNGNPAFDPPANAQDQVKTALARGAAGRWRVQAPPTDNQGRSTVRYEFPGEAQFASWQALPALPPDTTVRARIVSGAFNGTQLTVNAGPPVRIEYPAAVRPVPPCHDLELTLCDATGAPVQGAQIILEFQRNAFSDRRLPLPPPVTITPAQAEAIAKQALLHPMVAQPSFLRKLRPENSQRGEVIEREEFIRILLEFAANEGAGGAGLTPEHRTIVQNLVRENGIANPSEALSKIRDGAQQLEKDAPAEAMNVRFTKAIIAAIPSAFVGKINNWFDQTMERVAAEYKLRAQIVTVIGALLVAFAIQMDSLDLLKRLSTDDKLRDSLVAQAQEQQKRIDAQDNKPAQKDEDELQLAKARREEIEANLSRLRDPGMSVLPDRFIWQPLPQARLVRNAAWRHPYPRRLELIVGPSSYMIEPNWTSDPLKDIQRAIDGSGAPVSTRLEANRDAVITGADLDNLKLRVDGWDRLSLEGRVGVAKFQSRPKADETLYLIAGYNPVIPLKADADGKLATSLQDKKLLAALSIARMPVAVNAEETTLTAVSDDVRWIELRRQSEKPLTNILKPVTFEATTAWLDSAALLKAKDRKRSCDISVAEKSSPVDCDLGDITEALRKKGFEAKMRDHLVIVSRRNPPLQLRSNPGHAQSNILNGAPEQSCSILCVDGESLRRSGFGLAVTWMLLSLGAPFWYDVLKDSLKLRSSLAKKEEDARNDRLNDTSETKTKTA